MNPKVKIFAGPNNYDFQNVYFQEANEYIVGVDSGLQYLIDHNLHIDLAVGDFDSIDSEYLPKIMSESDKVLQLPKKKNMTDLAYALDEIHQQVSYGEIEVYGGIGKRVDHFLANVNLMKKYWISFRDDSHYLFLLEKGTHEIKHSFQYISFFAIEDCYELSLSGFKYSLDHYFLNTSDSICVSNEGNGIVSFSKGRLLVVCANE